MDQANVGVLPTSKNLLEVAPTPKTTLRDSCTYAGVESIVDVESALSKVNQIHSLLLTLTCGQGTTHSSFQNNPPDFTFLLDYNHNPSHSFAISAIILICLS